MILRAIALFEATDDWTFSFLTLCGYRIGYLISAIFICAEFQRLGIHHRQHRVLRSSFWMKLFFILIEVALAIRTSPSSQPLPQILPLPSSPPFPKSSPLYRIYASADCRPSLRHIHDLQGTPQRSRHPRVDHRLRFHLLHPDLRHGPAAGGTQAPPP